MSADHKDFHNSRPLDIHLWSNHPEVNEWVNRLWEERMPESVHDKPGGRKPKGRAKDQFKVLMLDLYVAWLEDPEQLIGVAMDDHAYQSGSRYNELFISWKLPRIVRAAHEVGLIGLWQGNEMSGLVTRVWPTEYLREHFRSALFSEFDLETPTTRECIILNSGKPEEDEEGDTTEGHQIGKSDLPAKKGQKTDQRSAKYPLEYKDTDHPDIPRWRANLRRYNELLRETFIDLGSADRPVVELSVADPKSKRKISRVRINQRSKFVRRVFYRGRWDLGGRLHGGWWQQVPSRYRKDILIDDQYTVEVDYSGLHVALIHALEGKPLRGDPYELGSLLYGVRKEDQREDVKNLVLMAINAETLEGAYQSFQSERNQEGRFAISHDTGERVQVTYDFELLKKLIQAFLERNPIMAKYLGTDQGVKLMRYDGEMAMRLLNYFTDKGIPVLSVHDSFIVEANQEVQLIQKMERIAQEVAGNHEFKLKQDQLSPTVIEHLRRNDPLIGREIPNYYNKLKQSVVRCKGYRERLIKFKVWRRGINGD